MRRRARDTIGVQNASAIPDDVLDRELDRVKQTLHAELAERLTDEDFDIYNADAVLNMAEHLFMLRVADRARAHPATANADMVPRKRIPRGIGELRRHEFDNANLAHHRNQLVYHENKLTTNGN
jgi:hypothetical protein